MHVESESSQAKCKHQDRGMPKFLEKTKLNYVFGRDYNVFTRIYFALILTLLGIMVLLGLINVISKYVHYPSGVYLGERPTREIPFPAVHLHNLNQVRKSFLYEVGIDPKSAEHETFIAEYYRGTDSDPAGDFKTNLEKVDEKLKAKKFLEGSAFYLKAAPKCDGNSIFVLQMDSNQSLAEKSVGCATHLKAHREKMWSEKNFREAKLIVDLTAFDYDTSSTVVEDGESGVRLVLTTPAHKRPVVNSGSVTIAPGTVTAIRVDAHEVRRLPLPYGDCKGDGLWYHDDKHKKEMPEDAFTQEDCKYDAMQEKVERQCECRPKFTIGFKDNGKPVCKGKQVTCMKKMGRVEEYGCPKPCTDVLYEPQVVSSGNIPAKEVFVKGKDFCPLAKKITAACKVDSMKKAITDKYANLCTISETANSTGQICSIVDNPSPDATELANLEDAVYQYATDNIAIVKLVLDKEMSPAFTVYATTDAATLFGEIGIILIIYFGFSIMNMFEAFYLFFAGLCNK